MPASTRTDVTEASASRPASLHDYVAVVRARRWLIITLPIVAAVAAFIFSASQDPVHQAEASVLVNQSAGVVTDITGIDPSTTDPERYLTTQANVARSPALAARVARTAKVPEIRTAADVLDISSVTPRADADVLDFVVDHGDAQGAMKIANAYTREFTRYKTELDTARIQEALRALRARLASLEREGQGGSATAQTLTQYESQLLTAAKLVSDSTSVLAPADDADQVSPRTSRNLVAAALLGFVLALGIAFAADALDRRARTEDEVTSILALPLLGRISTPPRELRTESELVMLAEPMTAQAEAFRKLRTTIEFVNREYGTRSLMFTSAIQGEGKSTTVANLAVAFARAGRRVVLVDLDIRQPSLHTFFGARPDRGVADAVAAGRPLEQVVQHIRLPKSQLPETESRVGRAGDRPRWAPSARLSTASQSGSNGQGTAPNLDFIACGTIPAFDEAFLGSDDVAAALERLREHYDIVLLDSPPFLAVAESMALSEKVDGVVVIAHLGTERPILRELARGLQQCGARTVGFVLTGVSQGDRHAYGYGYGYGYEMERAHLRAAEGGQAPTSLTRWAAGDE
jgi:Mrp family chromosome partitioning ATPase